MSKRKSIENPEVPGLEQNLPPPLPPVSPEKTPEIPAPANLLLENQPILQQVNSSIILNPSAQINCNESQPIPHIMPPLPYMSPAVPQPPVGQMMPWWVPIDADSTSVYPQWSENQNKVFASEVTNDSGTVHFKRKIEQVDPAKDAEKVASAQSELSALMKPLRCDLCNAVMNSTLQAKLHYEGKPHQKKVSMFLNQSVKKLKTDEGPITTTSSDWSSYCDICKTWFTSQADASQHYAGKKHIRATTGAPKKNPKKGSTPPVQVDPTGRFGIGMGFQLEPQGPSIAAETMEPVRPLIPQLPAPQLYNPVATTFSAALRCDLCGVTANRLEQLETHRRGTRHQKMLRLNGMIPAETNTPSEHVSTTTTTIDYSICRTPSGSYYCAPCDKSFTSENSFAQHVESKKHKNQVNPKQPANQSQQRLSNQDKYKKHKL
ncbi:zinc finger protein 346 isoform X2 [Fopius arisanus]|uniref:Zinc finger protein 346 isoform X2 n=1 Tax=Fopius arisanus TaxID=64838 RepID=A0A9R1TGZ4_9HYME|nr:PREDICTED: zinc finger protein 346-like isoform X2 [Fopius arisanus]